MFSRDNEESYHYKATVTRCPVMKLIFTFLAFLSTFTSVQGTLRENVSIDSSLILNQEVISVKMNDHIFTNFTFDCRNSSYDSYINLTTTDSSIASAEPLIKIKCYYQVIESSFSMYGKFIGKTELNIFDNERNSFAKKVKVDVLIENRKLTNIFIVFVAIFMVTLNFGFGAKLEIEVIKNILKRPIPPFIGFVCQFLLMPILGLTVSKIFKMENDLGFGLFVLSTCPGGGGSNVWTLILGGDLNLSLCMTLFSKISALFMMPLWLYAAGRFYILETISIPYKHIAIGLASLLIPCILGLGLRKWKNKAAEFVVKLLKPISGIFIIFVIIMGSITNLYIYKMWIRKWYIVPSSMICIYFGYILGYAIARLLKQEHVKSLTIAIETGVQDTGVAILLLQGTFVEPVGDVAATLPMTTALFTPLPLLCIAIGIQIKLRCFKVAKCTKCGNQSNHRGSNCVSKEIQPKIKFEENNELKTLNLYNGDNSVI